MKKLMKYVVIFFAVLIAQSCSNEKSKNDWTIDNLKGEVLSYSEISYKAVERFGNIEKGQRERNRNDREFGNEDGQFKYDEDGYKLCKYTYNSNGILDTNLSMVFFKKRDKSKKGVKNRFSKFDEKGYLIEENSYNTDGSLNKKVTHRYDKNGNRIEANSYNSDGSLKNKVIFKYDENGNRIETNSYNSDGSKNISWFLKYDEKSNMIEQSLSQYNSMTSFKFTYKHNEIGNVIETTTYNSDSSIDIKYTHTYEYDKKGNWVKRIDFINGIPSYILEREYKYY